MSIEEKSRLEYLGEFAVEQLSKYIMPFWRKYAVDEELGGFYGHINHDMSIDHNAVKGLVLNARILWTFSAVYKKFKNKKDLDLAKRAYDYISKHFYDKDFGGYYWSLTPEGSPAETKKQIYAQAFTVYAFSEYYKITSNPEILKKAIELFRLIEEYSFDPERNGYVEACTRGWKEIGDLRLSPKDMNEKKSMNTHLHVLEAYTNLYTVWKDAFLKKQLENLIGIFVAHIVNKEDFHLELFFDEDWNSKSTLFSYGHDIEASWLLHEAALVSGNKNLIRNIEELSVRIANAAKLGIFQNKALLYEDDRAGRHSDHEFEWWAQAEAVVGFLNAYAITLNEAYIEYACSIARFIEEYVVDKKNGEWYFRVDLEGKAIASHEKAGFWKCPYHNARACLEILHRKNILNS
ncbi:Cellobiose 2-epimerase [subsurface metagenome]